MTDDDKAINQRLVAARHALDLTQAEFAKRTKISKSYMGAIELGNRRVNDRIIKIISMTFGVNEVWLKSGQGNMFDNIEDFKLNQVISTFKKLDSSFQDYLIKQLDILLELQRIKATNNSDIASG
ncbi:MAG: helix-turn-helix transcriptional regulator [Treponema sp.]|jgi:transcriptional regulator with XRE-family HTH domain|nr:helix-turn-helix transcriptional regulator [Treponema sp.]